MSGSILPVYRWQVFNGSTPAAGAKLYSFLSGTSTPQFLYSNADLDPSHELTNPVIADGNGVFPIMYMAAVSYRIRIDNADGSALYAAQDNVFDLWQLFTGTTQTANTVFAGPTSGVAAVPTFRALVVADLPAAAVNVGQCEGRLTLTSGSPVTTSDVTAATTLYFTPYQGNRIALYDGSVWSLYTFTERSIAVPASTSQMYDVFLYNNSGTLTLELLAWTNDTTRATALTTQDGVYVKTGATTRRYLGSFRTTGVSGQTEDSAAKRFVWNNANRVARAVQLFTATGNWNYTTATIRQANASTVNQIAVVNGLAEDAIALSLMIAGVSNTNAAACSAGIGYDTTTAFTGVIPQVTLQASSVQVSLTTPLAHFPAVGYHYYAWNEESAAAGTTTWIGVSGSVAQSGLTGLWRS